MGQAGMGSDHASPAYSQDSAVRQAQAIVRNSGRMAFS